VSADARGVPPGVLIDALTPLEAAAEMDALAEKIKDHDKAYHQNDAPKIADAEPDRASRRLELLGAALAGREHHVGGRTMADADAVAAEAVDLLATEMDAVGQPGLRAEPADTFQVIDAAHAETADAGLLFVCHWIESQIRCSGEIQNYVNS